MKATFRNALLTAYGVGDALPSISEPVAEVDEEVGRYKEQKDADDGEASEPNQVRCRVELCEAVTHWRPQPLAASQDPPANSRSKSTGGFRAL